MNTKYFRQVIRWLEIAMTQEFLHRSVIMASIKQASE